MERKDDIQHDEIVTRDSEGETDEDGVKDDAEFEDKYSSHLSSKMVIIDHVVPLMTKVILASWRVGEVILPPGNTFIRKYYGRGAFARIVPVRVVVLGRVKKAKIGFFAAILAMIMNIAVLRIWNGCCTL